MRLSNTTGSAPLYVRWDGTTAVSAADGTYGVPSGMFDVYDLGLLGDKDVSVVGSGNVYSAEFLIVDPAVAD